MVPGPSQFFWFGPWSHPHLVIWSLVPAPGPCCFGPWSRWKLSRWSWSLGLFWPNVPGPGTILVKCPLSREPHSEPQNLIYAKRNKKGSSAEIFTRIQFRARDWKTRDERFISFYRINLIHTFFFIRMNFTRITQAHFLSKFWPKWAKISFSDAQNDQHDRARRDNDFKHII